MAINSTSTIATQASCLRRPGTSSMTMYTNNLQKQSDSNRVCIALGVKLLPSPAIAQIAAHAGYDGLFIDLEHSTLSLSDASIICTAALATNVTPFVRVPRECGAGFVQRVLDGGAMGVIFPHVHDAADAEAAVQMCKYPKRGTRSLTGQLPLFGLRPTAVGEVVRVGDEVGSSVVVMIETQESLENIDAIAAVEGVEVLLVGSNDLAMELGVPGRFDEGVFQEALRLVAGAARSHGVVFGVAGLYDRRDIMEHAVNNLEARYVLGQLDAGLLMKGACENAKDVRSIQPQ